MSQWILVTGFGPFERHSKNPSWSAVSKLPSQLAVHDDKESSTESTIRVVKRELAVAYRVLDEFYANLPQSAGETSLPLAIIHVGVAGGSNAVRLEKYAYNEALGKDVEHQVPPTGRVVAADPPGQRLGTVLDANKLLSHAATVCRHRYQFKPRIELSEDPGRYLCNYAYYKACRCHQAVIKTSLFIHVPEEHHPHSITELSQIVQAVVEHAVHQALYPRHKPLLTWLLACICP